MEPRALLGATFVLNMTTTWRSRTTKELKRTPSGSKHAVQGARESMKKASRNKVDGGLPVYLSPGSHVCAKHDPDRMQKLLYSLPPGLNALGCML